MGVSAAYIHQGLWTADAMVGESQTFSDSPIRARKIGVDYSLRRSRKAQGEGAIVVIDDLRDMVQLEPGTTVQGRIAKSGRVVVLLRHGAGARPRPLAYRSVVSCPQFRRHQS